MKTIWILVVALVGCGPAASSPVPDASHAPETRWANVLERLDSRRERAFVRGDPSLLGRVYLARSAVRRTDARLVRAYAHRGFEFQAVPMRLDEVDVMSRSDGRVRLRVVDRLGTVRVRRAGGPWQALPRDGPTERIITLHRGADGWRIADIRRVAG